MSLPAVSSKYYLAQYLFTASVRHQSWPGLTGRGLTPAKVNVCLCSWEPADHQIHWEKLLLYIHNLPLSFPGKLLQPSACRWHLCGSHESGVSARGKTSAATETKKISPPQIHTLQGHFSPHKLYTAFRVTLAVNKQPSVITNKWKMSDRPIYVPGWLMKLYNHVQLAD